MNAGYLNIYIILFIYAFKILKIILILVLLDLSAAFDTIDHSLLISRLANIGIAGNALKWFTSYISDCTSSILINGHISSPRNISYGVSGSVLGPILFNIYLLPIFDIISKFP